MDLAQSMKALRRVESTQADRKSRLAIKTTETSGRAFEMNVNFWERIGPFLKSRGHVLPWSHAQSSDTLG